VMVAKVTVMMMILKASSLQIAKESY